MCVHDTGAAVPEREKKVCGGVHALSGGGWGRLVMHWHAPWTPVGPQRSYLQNMGSGDEPLSPDEARQISPPLRRPAWGRSTTWPIVGDTGPPLRKAKQSCVCLLHSAHAWSIVYVQM